MSESQATPQVLIGPRVIDNRVCRLMYVKETDEVWTEEWKDGWVRASVLMRHVLNAPTPKPSQLRRRGIPLELGALEREDKCA